MVSCMKLMVAMAEGEEEGGGTLRREAEYFPFVFIYVRSRRGQTGSWFLVLGSGMQGNRLMDIDTASLCKLVCWISLPPLDIRVHGRQAVHSGNYAKFMSGAI